MKRVILATGAVALSAGLAFASGKTPAEVGDGVSVIQTAVIVYGTLAFLFLCATVAVKTIRR